MSLTGSHKNLLQSHCCTLQGREAEGMQKIGEYEADLKNKPTTKGKKYLLEIPLREVVERDMIKLTK